MSARPDIRPSAARRVPFDLIALPHLAVSIRHGSPSPSQVNPERAYPDLTGRALPSQSAAMSDLLVLGPQRRAPNLSSRLAAAGMTGPIAAITAGWQEREAELAALEEHLGQPVQDLRLYTRAEAVFAEDPEYHEAYRARQSALRETQDLYRLQLEHAKAAARELYLRATADASIASRAGRGRRGAAQARRSASRVDRRAASTLRAAVAIGRAAVHRSSLHRAQAHRRRRLDGADRRRSRRRAGQPPAIVRDAGAARAPNRSQHGRRAPWRSPPACCCFTTVRRRARETRRSSSTGSTSCRTPSSCRMPRRGLRSMIGERTALLARRLRPASCYTLDDRDWLLFRDGVLRAGAGSRRLARAGPPAAIEARA